VTRRAFVADDGVRIVYDDAGPPAGPPVVLCHGLAASARQFAEDAGHFAGLGYRVLAPNLRGHGESGKAARGRVADYTIARMAADLRQLLDNAGVGPVHWVGNSLGGILALELLKAHAERFRTLATFGTSFALNLPPLAAHVIPLSYAVLGRRLVAVITARGTTRDPGARALIADVLRTNDPQVGYAVAANLVRYDLREAARASRVPMLLLRGGLDRAVNRALRRTLPAVQGRAGFTLVEVPHGGHCANLDATDAVRRELLRFWTANA
jgi:pimeloyl-ACP methyl ester carboxylesterase